MSALADTRMTEPTPDDIRRAVRAACTAVNGRRKTGTVNLNESALKAIGNRVAREPEGACSHKGTESRTGAGHLVVAWWTNPAGLKFVRIRGWWEPDEERSEPVRTSGVGARPPVWYLTPERVYGVEADREAHWVCVCGCGAVGTAEAIGWALAAAPADGVCGPCYDRLQELGPSAIPTEPTAFDDRGFDPRLPLLSPDGRWVVALGAHTVRVWDRRTGELRLPNPGQILWQAMRSGVSPCGGFVFLGYTGQEFRFLDLRSDPPRMFAVPFGISPYRAHWTGRPGELVLQGRDGGRRWGTVSVPDGRSDRWYDPPGPYAELVAVSPFGPRAVFADRGWVTVLRLGRGDEPQQDAAFRLGTGEMNRTGNWTTEVAPLARFTPDGERLLFVTGDQLELWRPGRDRALVQATFPVRVWDAAFTPDAEWLIVLGGDGNVYTCHPGLLTHVTARFCWHVWQAQGLALSADGATLATAGAEGVKLWPLTRLLATARGSG
jgi:hypothetical protein